MSDKNFNGRSTSLCYLERDGQYLSGTTVTYGELARRLDCGSAQAVGQALRRNLFAPEIPCHCVVAADGSLCGFGGSRSSNALARKRRLLDEERQARAGAKGVGT